MTALLSLLPTLLQFLQGKKTYTLAGLLAAIAAGKLGGLVPDDVLSGLVPLLVAGIAYALREALTRVHVTVTKEQSEAFVRQALEALAKAGTVPPPTPAPAPLDTSVIGPRSVATMLLIGGCLLAMPGHADAGAPRAFFLSDNARGEYRVGDIIEFKAMPETEATHFSWSIKPIGERKVIIAEDGRSIRVSSQPGAFTLRFVESNAQGHAVTDHEVSVTTGRPGPTPSPQPQPEPDPQPEPTPEPQPEPEPEVKDRFGFVAATKRAALAISSKTRVKQAICLADKAHALQADVGDIVKQPQAILGAIGAALDSCTDKSWNKAREDLAERLGKTYASGQLRTLDDWRELIGEIETGLRAAAK